MLIPDREAYLKRLWRLMNTADIIKLSDEDLEWIFPDLDFDATCAELLTKTKAKLTIVTKGVRALSDTATAPVSPFLRIRCQRWWIRLGLAIRLWARY